MSPVMTTPSLSLKSKKLSTTKDLKSNLAQTNDNDRVKRSRYDSLLNISSTSTPVNSLPRKRKAVARRDSNQQSHASLVSKLIGNCSSGKGNSILEF